MGLRFFSIIFTAVLAVVVMKTAAVGRAGGLDAEQPVTPDVQKDIIDPFRAEVENKVGNALLKYEGVSYRTQVVAGTNFFVKVDIGGGSAAHLRVYRQFDGTLSLDALAIKPIERPIEHFEWATPSTQTIIIAVMAEYSALILP